MAQIFERGQFYYARFRHGTKDYFRSTGVKLPKHNASKDVKLAAQERARSQLEAMLAQVRGREPIEELFARLVEALDRLPEPDRAQKRIALAERLRRDLSQQLEISGAWDAWLNSPRKRRASDATIQMYLAYWGRDEVRKHGRQRQNGFKLWLAKRHPEVTYLHEVTPAIAEEYASHLWQSDIAPRTYNGVIKFLRSMFKVLHTRAGLVNNVWDDIPSQENGTEGRRNLTPDELSTVCSTAKDEMRYWFAIGLYTGLRLGDVLTLRWSEIDFEAGVIRRIPNKTRRKRKVVTFPLHPVLGALLRELHDTAKPSATYLFPSHAKLHEKGQSGKITAQIQKHFLECGIDIHREGTGTRLKRDKDGKPLRDDKERLVTKTFDKRASVEVGFHSLRHSFVSLCAQNRVPQVAIQELVGHGSPAMTELYSHAGEELKANAIAALPAVDFNIVSPHSK